VSILIDRSTKVCVQGITGRDGSFHTKQMLEYGRSSSDIIIRFQEDLLGARLRLEEALFSYRKAIINLERNKNTLLSKYWQGKI